METIVILVCYNGKWVTSKKMCKYEGGDSKGLIVPWTIKFSELLDRVHQIGNTNSREDKGHAGQTKEDKNSLAMRGHHYKKVLKLRFRRPQ
ncbi:unnamed protein product [Prunus armeniaca]